MVMRAWSKVADLNGSVPPAVEQLAERFRIYRQSTAPGERSLGFFFSIIALLYFAITYIPLLFVGKGFQQKQ